MSGTALVLRADAGRLPLPDNSVDLIVTSPPYFALRSYRDGGEHYAAQIGSEPTPQAFLEALWTVMAECWRVLKPTGSCFVNLGDKRSGSGGHNNSGIACTSGTASGSTLDGRLQQVSNRATRRNAPDRYNQAAFGRPKSKMLLPHRFAIGCEDGLADPEGKGWIVRGDYVWSKLNGLPESVTDRCRDSHEYLFHLVKEPRYFAAVDEVREPQKEPERSGTGWNVHSTKGTEGPSRQSMASTGLLDYNPLGKLPGSVWSLASEPLRISPEIQKAYNLPDHFAAFPSELVRRVILGWSPSGVCVECGEGRRPVVEKRYTTVGALYSNLNGTTHRSADNGGKGSTEATITGYACSCGVGSPKAPNAYGGPPNALGISPAVVLDPFGGTGTTAGVARALGRTGVSVDLSADYCRLARYFIFNSRRFAKATERTNRERQEVLAL